MLESKIQNQIRCALSKFGAVFRTNSGQFWQGSRMTLKQASAMYGPETLVLVKLRSVDGLPAGFSDLLFVGPGNVAFVETKNEVGHLRPEQKNFLKRMHSMGYVAGVARSVDEAVKLIGTGTD
ncbi:MAG TPA: VRR-NUC domain-containing protein [Ruminococcaceae bacterium]|jgi:hypothetical protein|nr:VRR-NUC domain-containing protein [Oscillospiraceae bacterium]